MDLWILTRSVNDYNQDGDYFVAAWAEKPTRDGIARVLFDTNWNQLVEHNKGLVKRVLDGGGREDGEWEWFHLVQVAHGEEYKPRGTVGL
jgi:hypothetical protein